MRFIPIFLLTFGQTKQIYIEENANLMKRRYKCYGINKERKSIL